MTRGGPLCGYVVPKGKSRRCATLNFATGKLPQVAHVRLISNILDTPCPYFGGSSTSHSVGVHLQPGGADGSGQRGASADLQHGCE